MRLYFYGLCMLIKKFILGKNTGDVVLWFSKKMGVVYIKLAQILAMQNIGNLFTEEDRQKLTSICDHCNPIAFQKIKKIMEKEYGRDLSKKFKKIYEEPLGSASISQVHKAVLKNGTVVAIKVKRQDVLKKVKMDIKQIRKLIHRFGKFFKFQNIIGSDVALNMYLDWILEETDFEHEIQNIIDFSRFAKSVNNTILNTKKIGHTGTLDPLATGVLVLCVGKATRLSELVTAYDKEYFASVVLGLSTDTLDVTGTVLKEENVHIEKEKIEKVLSLFQKTYMQKVPIYSAVKIKGKKLYEYARENKDVEIPSRMVTIFSTHL